MPRSGSINAVITISVLMALAVLAYWTVWLIAPEAVQTRVPGAADYELYRAFESAFPVPDIWVAVCALLGAWGLWARRLILNPVSAYLLWWQRRAVLDGPGVDRVR